MKKILNGLNGYGVTICTILTVFIFFSTCGTKPKIEKESKQVELLNKKVDSLTNLTRQQVSRDELNLLLQINSLEISKEVVYTNNAIVRTVERPDDVINGYDKKIKELQSKLNQLHDQK